MIYWKVINSRIALITLLAFLSPANRADSREIDIQSIVDLGFIIRCSEMIGTNYLDQIELVYSGETAADYLPKLTVDIFQTMRDRPDRREDRGRSYYDWGTCEEAAKVTASGTANSSGNFHIKIEVDNSKDSPLYQFTGAGSETYLTVGQWKFTNMDGPFAIEEPMLTQESIPFYKGKTVSSVNRAWRQCTMLGDDGSFSPLEAFLKSHE